jgi:hypothetical protein
MAERVTIGIGGMAIAVRCGDAAFARMLEERYAGFVRPEAKAEFELEVELTAAAEADPDLEVEVRREGARWMLRRGDFHAEWEPEARRGRVRQSANPYAIDTVLRILHSLLLAKAGGFLVHGASAVRNGKAFLFAGVSGAGKTTISRLAPPDVTLLTDEISYVRPMDNGYLAFGTPFAGELAKVGENISAPLAALYLLEQAPENRIVPVEPQEAARRLLRNILFFTEDPELVNNVFTSACEFVGRVPVFRLRFLPDARVWGLIG